MKRTTSHQLTTLRAMSQIASGVEVFSDALAARPPSEVRRRAAEAARALLAPPR